MILESFFSHSDRSLQHLFDMGRILRLAEQAAAEADGRPHGLEGVGVQFLRHEADHRARGAIIPLDVMAVDRDAAARSELTMPQMMLISVVLPAPFGPSSAKISPRLMSRLMSFSAVKAGA